MLMMRAPAVRSRPRAEAASSNLLALHRAVQKPAPMPHGTRARFAAIHQLISSFRVRVGDPARARITRRDPRDAAEEGRRQWRVFHKGFAFTASPSPGGPRPRPQKGPAALPDLIAAATAADPGKKGLKLPTCASLVCAMAA